MVFARDRELPKAVQMQTDERSVSLSVYFTADGWHFNARVGDVTVTDAGPYSRDVAVAEATAWVRLRTLHTNPDGSMK